MNWLSRDPRGMYSSCRQQALFQRSSFGHQRGIWLARFSCRTPIQVEQLIGCWFDELFWFPCGLCVFPSPDTLVEEAFSSPDCFMLCNLFDLVHLRLVTLIIRILTFDISRFRKVLHWFFYCCWYWNMFLEGRYLESAGFLRQLLVFHLLNTRWTRTILLRIGLLIWLGIFWAGRAEKLMYVLLYGLIISFSVALNTWGAWRRFAIY